MAVACEKKMNEFEIEHPKLWVCVKRKLSGMELCWDRVEMACHGERLERAKRREAAT
jgi:hypothetical protein